MRTWGELLTGAAIWIGGVSIYLAFAMLMTLHVVFWLFGVWIPWFVAIFGGILGPILTVGWFVLWLLHFIPAVHFPLFVRG